MAGSTHPLQPSLTSAPLTRRTFVRGAAAVLVAGAAAYVGIKWRAAIQEPSPWQVLETLTQASFAEHVGEIFNLEVSPGENVALQLLQLNELKAAAQGGEAFSLLLRGASQQRLAQGTYMVRHAQLGTFPLFIVPAPSGNGASTEYDYLVTFNRIVL